MDNVYKLNVIYPRNPQRARENNPRILMSWIKSRQRALKDAPTFGKVSYPHNTAMVKKE